MIKKDQSKYDSIIAALDKMKKETPLVNCITNAVTINDCANAILAIGGSPAMAEDIGDLSDFLKIANSLVINIGILNEDRIEVIYKACSDADKLKLPIILDPVGVGITDLRKKITIDLINNHDIAAICGNISEIKAIYDLLKIDELENISKNIAKGVDASEMDIVTENNLDENCKLVKILAKKINTVIIASGAIDIISDGKTSYIIKNGDFMMSKITGSGCMLTSVVGAFCGSNEPYISGIAGTISMGIAGEKAGEFVKKDNSGTGTFRTKLIDYLYLLDDEEINNKSKIYEVK